MKKLVSIFLCLALLLAAFPVLPREAEAATAQETGNAILENVLKQDGTFPETLPEGQTTHTAYCYVCKAEKEWTPFTTQLTGGSKSFPDGAHYYLPKNVTIDGQLFLFEAASPKTMCFHTNGKTLTDNTYRMMLVASGCTMNMMGGGAIHCNTKNNRGILYSNAACKINVYGTTLKNTATTVSDSGNATVCLYGTNGVANLWGATLIGNSVSPVILTNGAVNLYNCTVTGLPAQVGNYAGQSDSKAALNLYDTTISGVDVQDGVGITVSGATKIGSLTLASGKTVNPSALTAGASIGIAQKGTFTPAGMAQYAKYFTAAVTDCLINANSDGSLRCMPEGIMLVDAAGNETEAEDVLAAWETGSYAFVRVYGDNTLALSGQEIPVDLCGSELTVTGSGKVLLMDSANDSYDHTACGILVNQGDAITVEGAVNAPNGNSYVTLTEENRVTAHRISIELNTVTLRTAAAGVYYKAAYSCDAQVAKQVQSYGVVVSLYNMPGADFMTEPENGNFNAWTEAAVPFQSGAVATSGSVFGIMKDIRSAATNDRYGKMKIYANAYIDLGNGPIVANYADAGKTADAEGFKGTALSLYDVMQKLDSSYASYPTATRLQLDAFYAQWKEKGMDWGFGAIGTSTGITGKIDNSDIDLKFDEGTTNAVCPVCNEKVTWTAFVPGADSQGLTGHYYLTDDVNFTGTNAAGIFYSSTKNQTLCFHLNGHNLTATKTRAIFGSSGKLNVMGNGIVTGYNSAATGAAVQTNNSVAGNVVSLYGGTYKRASNTNSKAAAIGTNNCGEIRVYAGATIDAPGAMAVLQTAPNNARNSYVGLFGCTVNGDVVNNGSGSFASSLEIVDATVNGTVKTAESNVYVSGAAKISGVALEGEARLQLGALTEGADIAISTTGAFTERSDDAVAYAKYFRGAGAADSILVKDKTLYCGRDYLSDLQFAEGTTDALCPVCGEIKTWTPVDGSAAITGEKVNAHYYLSQDIEFTADSGVLALINPPHGTHTVCIHLNGHNFTGTNARFVYGSTCVTNVMGSGTVTGNRADKYPYGSTVQINVASTAGTVNLYGGTYTQGENGTYSATDYVLSLSDNGSNINVYEDAKVVANSNGKAIYMGKSGMAASSMIIRGTVEGDVDVAAPSKTNATSLTLDGCTVSGTVTMGEGTDLTVSHAAKVQLLDIPESVQATLESMTPGAQIVIANEGIFTKANANAAGWAKYFSAYNQGDKILVQDDQLRCKTDYEAKLYPDAEGKAYCPVCKETKTWTAITSGEAKVATVDGGHYYLANDIVYELAYNGDTNTAFFSGVAARNSSTCLHLNGHDLTATATHAIFTGWGITNVMGEGVVSGYGSGSANAGAAVQVNNSVSASGVYLYSGTYRGTADAKSQYVAAISHAGGGLYIYEDADIASTTDKAIMVGQSGYRDSYLEIYGATIGGGIDTYTPVPKNNGTYQNKLLFKNATIDGTVDLAAGNSYTLEGLTKITKLQVAAGQTVDFVDMKAGSKIAVSADGIFSGAMEQADAWLDYLTCADAGDWIVVRDNAFYQGVKETIPTASESDQTALDTTYAGTTVRHGEMHNHTNSGPYRDDGTGNVYSTGADGKNSLTEWIAEMDRLKMDFAFIVDHGMSIHMYNENFKSDYFIGGTEPGTTITDSKANPKSPHYNMLFADAAKLESIFFKYESKFKPVRWNLENFPTAQTPSEVGYRVKYPTWTTAEFGQLAKDVYDAGGLLVQVHPKYDSYIYSDDPLDYYFADYSGFEIATGSGGNMMYKDNNEAYETWVELLEMGKKIWATAGSDRHRLPDISGMTVMYTVEDEATEYMETVRQGNMAPGWVGIRMNVGTTAMGGETDFTGNRLQFSVGDIYNSGEKDYVNTPDPYVEGHTYRVELYDDGGILMTAYVDPTEMNYFAIDCDASAMYYRVVVWDETDNERIGVSNPIWNTAYTAE